MIRGALIINSFLKTKKFLEHYEWLKKAAKNESIDLYLFENTDLICQMQLEDAEAELKIFLSMDFVLYWDKDFSGGEMLKHLLKRRNIPIFNSINSVKICDDKFQTYLRIMDYNMENPDRKIEIIPTIAAPMTYENIGYTENDFVEKVIEKLGVPMIIKECCGSFGMQVYLAKNNSDVYEITRRLAGKSFIYQKYIENSSGRDVRLQVVGEKVVAAMKRFSECGDYRANLSNGGKMKKYIPDEREKMVAVNAIKALDLSFGGVDLLFDKSDKATILCEVNSNAHFRNIYECTGVNVAEHIIKYIKEKL